MSSTLETSYSASSYTSTTKMITRRDQNGNLVRMHRDSSLPPPIRKSKLIPESHAVVPLKPTPPPRKHVSISQSDLQCSYPPDSNRIYINHNVAINVDRQLPQRSSYRPVSRQSHLTPNLSSNQRGTIHSNYDESPSQYYYYGSQRANQYPLSPGQNSNYYRNLNQGQTLPVKKSPYPNYAFHIPPPAPTSNYNRYGSRSSSASYDRFGHHALDKAYPAQTTQAIPDMLTTAERQQLDYERQTSQKIILSEGNLLTAHIKTIRDDGRDNPFKPGTELSWEADLIVRLYKKGHPLSEVPQLLDKIKRQVEENAVKSATDLDYKSDQAKEVRIVNRSKTVSNDLCSAPENQLLQCDRKRSSGNVLLIGSERTSLQKIPVEDEVIDRIISKLDDHQQDSRDSQQDRENKQQNDINVFREGRIQSKSGTTTSNNNNNINNTKAPASVVKKNHKKKLGDKEGEVRKKQTDSSKAKFKPKKVRPTKGSDNDEIQEASNSKSARSGCCSIQ